MQEKIIFGVLAFLLLTITGNCQYNKMLSEGSEWYHYFWFEGSCNHKLIVKGDTLINNQEYKKIINEGDLCNFEYYTFAREDTINKQVYYYYYDTTEAMIYDFSMQIGDTIKSTFQYYRFELVLDSITSYLPQYAPCFDPPELFMERPKVFYLSVTGCDYCDPVIWVEGIGNIANPFRSSFVWTAGNLGNVLLCHYDNTGFRDYHYTFCDESEPCLGPIIKTEDIEESTRVTLFPNPCIDKVHFEVNDGIFLKSIKFYDLNGLTLKEIDYPNHLIDLSDLPSGLIYAIIETSEKRIIVKKIVKY